MSRDDFRPLHSSECWELCPDCGEQLDWAREECVCLDCPRYLEVTRSLEAEPVYSPLRDVREPIADSERFLPVKEAV